MLSLPNHFLSAHSHHTMCVHRCPGSTCKNDAGKG